MNNKTRLRRILLLIFVLSSFNLFGQSPTFKWVKNIPFEIKGQCTDNEDNIYIAGDFKDTMLFENNLVIGQSSDVMIAKFDSSGSLLWFQQFGGPEHDGSVDIEFDQNDNLIVTNFFNRFTVYDGDTIVAGDNSHGGILLKLSMDGDLIWYKVPGYNDNGCFHVFSSAVDRDNNILLTGNIQWGNGIFTDTIIPSLGLIPGFAAKYDTYGNFEWVRKFDYMIAQNIFDYSGNILLFAGSIQKYSASDSLLWELTENSYFSGSDFWPKVAVDSLDYIYIAPTFSNSFIIGNDTLEPLGSSRFLYAKLDATGAPVLIESAFSPYLFDANSIILNKNKILITGEFKDKICFESDSLLSMSNQRYNSYIAEYDLAGNLIFIKKIDSNKGCSSRLVSASKSIYLSGYSSDTAYFDNIVFITDPLSYGAYFLSRIQNVVIHPVFYPETFELYPNPTQGSLTIKCNPTYSNVTLEIYNIQGTLICKRLLDNYLETISLDDLQQGLYIIMLKTADKVLCKKIEKF